MSPYAHGVISRASAVALALVAALPVAARADARAYRGPHPIDLDGHWHLDDSLHVHDDLVVGLEPFGDVEGVLVFLADPLAFGWSGDVWTYRGAHPLPGGLPGYCDVPGEHRHPFAPEGSFRREDDGTYVFIGGMRGGFAMVRPGRVTPRRPIVTADVVPYGSTTPSVAPYWLGGCLHTLVWGRNGPVPVPLDGCVPRAAHHRRRDPPPAAAPPPVVDGRGYSRIPSRTRGVMPDRLERPRSQSNER